LHHINPWITKRPNYSVKIKNGDKCNFCGVAANESNIETFNIDHLIPLFCGGKNIDVNLQKLCKKCHE